MKPSPPSRARYDHVQRSRRRASLAVFSMLIAFYLASMTLLWGVARLFVLAWLHSLHRIWPPSPAEMAFVLVAAVVTAFVHWFDAVGSGVRRILDSLGAVSPDPDDRYHRALINVAEEMRIAAGLGRVEVYVIPIQALNALSLTDLRGRTVVGVTEGLLSRLGRAQLQGVVAHEMAHAREGDTLLVTLSCSLFGVFAQLLDRLTKVAEADGRALFFYPLLWTLAVGARLLNVLVSRQREYLADAGAVALTRDPVALAEALYRLGRGWRGEGMAREELAPLFTVDPAAAGLSESEGFWADLFATHPPLLKRVRALLAMGKTGFSALVARVEAPEKVPTTERAEGEARPVAGAGSPPVSLPDSVVWGALPIPIVPPGAVPSGGGLPCPLCRVPLGDREYEGVTVRSCARCGGHLLKMGQDYRIIAREEEIFPDVIVKKAEALLTGTPLRPRQEPRAKKVAPLLLSCPSCGHPMSRVLYNYQYFVEVDRCHSCRLIWFDGGELEVLQVLVEKARRMSGPG
jgi:heat shock protein HtpX